MPKTPKIPVCALLFGACFLPLGQKAIGQSSAKNSLTIWVDATVASEKAEAAAVCRQFGRAMLQQKGPLGFGFAHAVSCRQASGLDHSPENSVTQEVKRSGQSQSESAGRIAWHLTIAQKESTLELTIFIPTARPDQTLLRQAHVSIPVDTKQSPSQSVLKNDRVVQLTSLALLDQLPILGIGSARMIGPTGALEPIRDPLFRDLEGKLQYELVPVHAVFSQSKAWWDISTAQISNSGQTWYLANAIGAGVNLPVLITAINLEVRSVESAAARDSTKAQENTALPPTHPTTTEPRRNLSLWADLSGGAFLITGFKSPLLSTQFSMGAKGLLNLQPFITARLNRTPYRASLPQTSSVDDSNATSSELVYEEADLAIGNAWSFPFSQGNQLLAGISFGLTQHSVSVVESNNDAFNNLDDRLILYPSLHFGYLWEAENWRIQTDARASTLLPYVDQFSVYEATVIAGYTVRNLLFNKSKISAGPMAQIAYRTIDKSFPSDGSRDSAPKTSAHTLGFPIGAYLRLEIETGD
jgi:hypothetical protein